MTEQEKYFARLNREAEKSEKPQSLWSKFWGGDSDYKPETDVYRGVGLDYEGMGSKES